MPETRRTFLLGSALLPLGAKAEARSELPRIRLGKYSVSRLVCGANPFNGGSHTNIFLNRHMRDYYKEERILATLRRCEQLGVNTWQSGPKNIDHYIRFRKLGLNMQYLSLDADPQRIQHLVEGGSIGIAHHGEASDRLFKAGQIDRMQDYLKRVRDAGVLVGISTHMPAVIDTIESKGWDVDYYMTCVYERDRSAEEIKQLLGYVPMPVGELYLQEDPPRMFKMIRQTKRTCFAFKILAAGRVSAKPELVEAAFKTALESIKPGDGVIVGMYDEYSDQPKENVNLVTKYSLKS